MTSGDAALAAGAALTAGVAGTASADLITGTFTGTIFNSEDGQNTFGAGTGLGTVNGESVTGTFSYVFEQVPSNQCDSGFGCYFDTDGVNWLNMNVTINGVTLTVPTVDTHFQAVYNHDKSTAGYDYFAVYEQDSKKRLRSRHRHRGIPRQSAVAFSDYLTEFARGSDVPATNFVWPGDDGNDGPTATLTSVITFMSMRPTHSYVITIQMRRGLSTVSRCASSDSRSTRGEQAGALRRWSRRTWIAVASQEDGSAQ